MKKSLLFLLFIFSLSVNAQEIDSRGAVSASNTPIAKGQTWAIVVGISDYLYLPKLQFAHRDAEIFAGYLIDEQKVPADNVRLFLNDRATTNNVVLEFKEILKKVKANDKVYFYFAGHGDNETVKGNEFSVLLLHGIKERDYVLGNDYIEMQLINQWITDLRLKGANTIFIADACHSGANLLVGGTSGTQSTQQALKDVVKAETKLLSCQVGQLSLEGKQWSGGRGNFSYHLISGLMGLADGYADDTKDGIIKYDELENYLIKEVNKEARPNSQKPEIQTVSEELVSVINNEKLQKYIRSQKTSMAFFTKVNTKGSEEYLLKALDSTTRGIYSKFELCLNTKLLITPETNCANYYLGLVAKNEQNERIIAIMKRNLVAVLQEDGNKLLTNCFKIGALGGETVITMVKKDSLIQMIQYFDKSIEILKDNYLLSRIKARKEFLEMLLLTYDKGSMKEGKIIGQAITTLKKSLEKEPDVFYTLTALGYYYSARQVIDSCIYYYQKCLELDPNFLFANDVVATEYFIKGDMKNARKYYQNHLEQLPKSTFSYIGIGNTYRLEGNFQKANDYYQKAYLLDKTKIETMVGILETRTNKEEKQKFSKIFLTEINKSKKEVQQIDFDRFDLYWTMKDTLRAKSIADKYISKAKISEEVGMKFNDFYRSIKDCKAYEKLRLNYIEDNPNDANGYHLLGMVYCIECYDPIKAEKYLLKSYSLDSSNYMACSGLCNFYNQNVTYEKKRDINKAIYFGERALKIYDGNYTSYIALGSIYKEKEDYSKAMIFYKKALPLQEKMKVGYIDMNKNLAITNLMIGNTFDDLSLTDSSIYYTKKSIQLDSTNIYAFISLGSRYFSLQQYDKALETVLYAFNQINKTNRTLLSNIGLYYYILDKPKDSNFYFELMRNSLNTGPKLQNGEPFEELGTTHLMFMSNNYAYLNNLSKAEEFAKQYIKQNPNEIGGYSALALAYRKAGKTDEAKTLSEKMFEINSKDFRGYSNLSKIYTKTQDIPKALEYFEKALQNGLTRPIDYERLTKTDDEWTDLRNNPTFQSLITTYFKKK